MKRLAFVVFLVLFVLWLGWTHALKPSRTDAVNHRHAKESSEREDMSSNASRSDFKPVPIPTKQPVLMDPNRLGDEAFHARVTRHMQLRYYDESPAKDTPEAVEIRGMLERIGVGREAVPVAYNAVWNYRHHYRIWVEAGKPDGGDSTANQFRDGSIVRMQQKFGITNEEFFNRIFEMKPTVFWGLENIQLPHSGTELLE